MPRMTRLYVLLFLILPGFAYSSEKLELSLDNGLDITIDHYQADGDTLVIWIPSEYGFGKGQIPVSLDLASLGLDVWVLRLHQSLMLPSGRTSLNEVEIDDLLSVTRSARQQGFKRIFLMSSNRGGLLALKLAYQWQLDKHAADFIRGLILFSPHLFRGRTEPGFDAAYEEISAYSNLPIYLIQAQYSTKYARTREIAARLERGGSPLFIHTIRGVQGGYQARPEDDLTAEDISARGRLGALIENAVALLTSYPAAEFRPGLTQEADQGEDSSNGPRETTLHRYRGSVFAPDLNLTNLDGVQYNLKNHRGKVVLVNFWATWCGPCVREIPSLTRLVKRLPTDSFEVIAVNIGEPRDTVEEFIRNSPVNFDILLDQNSSAVRDWKVYAYPSNYLIDQQGLIRYAYRGALEWDDESVVKIIEDLVSEP
ncbi:MAG: redoxin domain-containing protein [Candidatus Marinimicrobia bacterium]|jgi:thiol-disulfide isomerase/thioredoxin|nr:redoxin domain-containing protein [Candidatus Neomarinimicrobiota bacterium]